MSSHFRTLRFKLAALYLTVFGVIQTALCVAILIIRENSLYRDFDLGLVERADDIAVKIRESIEARPESLATAGFKNALNLQRYDGYFIQVALPDGTIVHRSANLGDRLLPQNIHRSNAGAETPFDLETIEGDSVTSLAGAGGQLRLLTRFEDSANGYPFRLQLGRSVTTINVRIAALRRLFLIAIPLGLLASGAASWFVARGSLAPISKIVREARALTVSDLHRRIETPNSGDEVAEMVTVINQMLDRLEAAFRAQERFIADVSHELKTPLAVLIGEAQVLSQRQRPIEDHIRFAGSVQDELQRLSRIVHSLLMLARADAGLPLPDARPLSINEIVADSVHRCDQSAKERQVAIVPSLAMPARDGAAPMVLGDPDLLGAVIDNLIRNSIRFAPAQTRIDVVVAAEMDHINVTVRDKGPGIAAEYLEKVFGRFFHLPGGDQRIRGTGLGLAIARGMVELHRGTIHAGNATNGGCELIVQLPRSRAT